MKHNKNSNRKENTPTHSKYMIRKLVCSNCIIQLLWVGNKKHKTSSFFYIKKTKLI